MHSRHLTQLSPFILILILLSACREKEIDPSFIEERCTDGVDNNGDGLVDCEDPTCSQFASCSGNEHCYNGVDDNGNGLIDCEDDTCQGLFICQDDIEDCSNGKDDDNDGAVDCQDTACQNTNICKPGAEHCSNGVDDDGDSLIDCDDPDCSSVFFCLAKFEIPGNSIDDDGDGATDCDDPELAMTSDCLDSGEVCTNGQDDDGDGLADCLDNDCANTSTCLFPAEVCNNGVDDDGDGDTDCADSSCTGSFYCAAEICNDGVDNDGNGLIDCDDTDTCPSTLYNCLNSLIVEICDDDVDNDLNGLIDCDDSACANDPECTGTIIEICGNNIDDDGNGATDCDDSACNADPLCQNTRVEICGNNIDDDNNGFTDCADPACSSDETCECDTPPDPIIDPVTQQMIPDCSVAECAYMFPSCQPSDVELCDGDGVDNDGDGLIDCDDPDCHDFMSDDAYCTRALCGDPDNNFTVVTYASVADDPSQKTLYVTDPFDFDFFIADDGVTLLRGELFFDVSELGEYTLTSTVSPLRCVVPDTTTGHTGMLRFEGSGLTDLTPLSTMTVAGHLTVAGQTTDEEPFTGLTGLRHILGNLTTVEPGYFAEPPADSQMSFTGLENLRTLGGDVVVDYYTSATQDYSTRKITLDGLDNLTWVGGTLVKVRDFYDESDTDFGCNLHQGEGYTYLSGEMTRLGSVQPLLSLRYVGGNICFIPDDGFTDFTGFNQLTEIKESLIVGDAYESPQTKLTFHGLENLTSIGQSFIVDMDDAMITDAILVESFEGLDNLESIGGDFIFPVALTWQDFTGLESLTTVGGNLIINSYYNPDQGIGTPPTMSFNGLQNLTTIGGYLRNSSLESGFSYNEPRGITDTSALTSLTSTGGMELYLAPTFTDFDGLQNLSTINGDLLIQSNYMSTVSGATAITFNGLNNLTSITGRFSPKGVTAQDFTGLGSLASVGSMEIEVASYSLTTLQNFGGLDSLHTVTNEFAFYYYNYDDTLVTGLEPQPFLPLSTLQNVGGIYISGSESNPVTGLQGFENIQTVGDLQILYTSNLTDLTGLDNLTSITGLLYIYATGLTSLTGLSGVTTLGGGLTLQDNILLTDITQLLNITDFQGFNIDITNNYMLSSCIVDDVVNHLMGINPSATQFVGDNLNDTCP